jgi:hypothetical protein
MVWPAGEVERPWEWVVKAFEAAIRKALQKIDSTDPTVRARIYESAREALSGSQAKQGVSVADATVQKRRLDELIEDIDREFRQAGRPEAAETVSAPEPPDGRGRQAARQDPPPMLDAGADRSSGLRQSAASSASQPAGELRAERVAQSARAERPRRRQKDADSDLLGAKTGSGGKKARRRRRPVYSLILVTALAIAFVGIGVLWVVFNDLFLSPEQRDTSIPNPPATVVGGDFAGGLATDGSSSGDWIDVFLPDDQSGVAGQDGARAALVEISGQQALQIVSQDPGADGEFLFELDPAVLRDLAGGKSLVAVTLRASSDTPTQIYIRCMLPEGENCGRHRFDVTYEIGDVVFSLDLTGKPAAGGPGYLALNSDVTGSGHGVDVFAIRVRPQ